MSIDLSGKRIFVQQPSDNANPNDILISDFSDAILRFIAERGDDNQLQYVENIDVAKNLINKEKENSNILPPHLEELEKLEETKEEFHLI